MKADTPQAVHINYLTWSIAGALTQHTIILHRDKRRQPKGLSPSVRSRPEATTACRAHVAGCKPMCEITPCQSWDHALSCVIGFTCMLTTCVAAWDCKKGLRSCNYCHIHPRGYKLDPKVTAGHYDLTRSIERKFKSRSRAYNRRPILHDGSPRKGETWHQASVALTHSALSQTAQQQPVSHLALPLHRPL